jgi:divalent metal cation (Fe/Co/Zn/Cd) transporter
MRAAGKLLKNPFFISLFVSVLFLGVSIFLIITSTNRLPLAVPIWFSKPWGEERLADPTFLWLIPVINAFLIFANLLLAYYFRAKERVLYSILIWVSPIISIMFFYTLFKIVLVAT